MGWFNTTNTVLFVTWAFSKCSTDARTIVHDGKEITLSPYEFITGRGKTSADCLLTESALRNQLTSMQNAGLLKKTTNSATNRYTCYVWVTERFYKHNNQLNDQLTTNSRPTERPQSRRENIRTKETETPPPPQTPQKKEEDEEDKKKILEIIKACAKNKYPFSETGIYAIYQETSGYAIQEAINKYANDNRKSKTPFMPDLPDRWLRTEAIKQQEFQLLKKDYG